MSAANAAGLPQALIGGVAYGGYARKVWFLLLKADLAYFVYIGCYFPSFVIKASFSIISCII